MAITDAQIRSFRPAERPFKRADAKGLYIEVMPNGSKLWRFKYRIGGKEKRRALGAYPEIKLAEARKRRDEARAKLDRDIDPALAPSPSAYLRAAVRRKAVRLAAPVGSEWVGFGMVYRRYIGTTLAPSAS
ncbi:MAG: hypothetical protein CL949_09000 [Erythrobacter sp.]|nr:hypothetical protein [Erythrobacter sp.]|tara:strand:- start:157 stop:549 length:393 start_codon:yes stop_codon:yes gene_type:complete